jgi:hypothetical protein
MTRTPGGRGCGSGGRGPLRSRCSVPISAAAGGPTDFSAVAAVVLCAIAASSLAREGRVTSVGCANSASLDVKAASTRPESGVVRVFFATIERWAHAVSSSAPERLFNSVKSLSRKAADSSGSGAGFGGDHGFRVAPNDPRN